MTVRARDPSAKTTPPCCGACRYRPLPWPAVSAPRGFVAGLAGTAGLGLTVFPSLSAGRHARAQSTAPVSPITTAVAPPPLQAAPPPPPPAAPPIQATPPITVPTVADEQARLRAPSMVVVDLSDAPDTEQPSRPPPGTDGRRRRERAGCGAGAPPQSR